MRRLIGFYILVPSISSYLCCVLHFFYLSVAPLMGTSLTEGHFIFGGLSSVIIIPLSIIGIYIGNSFAPLFTASPGKAFYFYMPVILSLAMMLALH